MKQLQHPENMVGCINAILSACMQGESQRRVCKRIYGESNNLERLEAGDKMVMQQLV